MLGMKWLLFPHVVLGNAGLTPATQIGIHTATAVGMSADEDLTSLSCLFGPHIHSAGATGITGCLRAVYHDPAQSSVALFYFRCGKTCLGPVHL